MKKPYTGNEETLLDLLTNRIPPGVDEAAYVKAGFLAAVARGESQTFVIGGSDVVFEPQDLLVETESAEGFACAEEGGYLLLGKGQIALIDFSNLATNTPGNKRRQLGRVSGG